jgi:hypothetical protein
VSDPVRIREAGDVPEELRELFRSAAKPQPLTPALGAMLSSRVAGMAAASAPTPVLVKVLPWLLGGAVAFGGVAAYRSGRVEPGAPKPAAPAPALAPAPEPIAPAPPALARAAEPPSRAVATRAPASRVATAEDGLVGEERLLNEAHEALAASPRRALALAQSHARRYPHGQLVAERDLITIEALVELGRRPEAEALGRDLRKTAPNNIYEERLDQILRKK